mmetsp:Transcript_367/g.768  ORF Transcript_367/g.768 Transcript_367/m.768 type:complete len:251 (-) Transcript_367:67-819(-)
MGTRDENTFMARLAEQCERWDDMVEYMTRIVTMGAELTLEERNLLSVAFKQSVSSRRQAWRVIMMEEQRNPGIAAGIANYRNGLEGELHIKCTEMIKLLDTHLIEKATDGEGKVFFMKMKGDYWRYHAEFQGDQAGKDASANAANGAYAEALTQAKESLNPAHPVRLGLALNYSVFFNEVMGQVAEAVGLARATLEEAQADLPNLDENAQRDSHQVLQLLKDNLDLWQSNAKAAGGGRQPELDGTAVEDL